jgi:hypothetical protein
MSAIKIALALTTGAVLVVCTANSVIDAMRWWHARQLRGRDLNFLNKVVRPNVRRVK